MAADRQLEIEGLLISVDVAAALHVRDVVRYGEVAEESLIPRRRLQDRFQTRPPVWGRRILQWLSMMPRRPRVPA